MYQIPLFPLNTVLFPGMPIYLHIFEERYKEMIKFCVGENMPFGVVLIGRGKEVGAPAEPRPIGCSALIQDIQPLANGRMNITAVGQERFRIQSLDYDKAYLRGQVDILTLQESRSAKTKATMRGLRQLLANYLAELAKVGQVELDFNQLPDEPITLSYLTATLLQAPIEVKQKLLLIDESEELLQTVYQTCRTELSILRAMLVMDKGKMLSAGGRFSMN